MNVYCKSCNILSTMRYVPDYHNFISLLCFKMIIGKHGYDIFEFNNNGYLVTKDTFIYLMQNGFLKSLMEIYNNRICISK